MAWDLLGDLSKAILNRNCGVCRPGGCSLHYGIGCWSRSLCHRRCFKTNSGQGSQVTKLYVKAAGQQGPFWTITEVFGDEKTSRGLHQGHRSLSFMSKSEQQETPSADGPSHFARLGSSVTRDQGRDHHGQSQEGQLGTTVTRQLLLFPSWQSLSHHSSASLLELDYY